jgi:hypothetical protein
MRGVTSLHIVSRRRGDVRRQRERRNTERLASGLRQSRHSDPSAVSGPVSGTRRGLRMAVSAPDPASVARSGYGHGYSFSDGNRALCLSARLCRSPAFGFGSRYCRDSSPRSSSADERRRRSALAPPNDPKPKTWALACVDTSTGPLSRHQGFLEVLPCEPSRLTPRRFALYSEKLDNFVQFLNHAIREDDV